MAMKDTTIDQSGAATTKKLYEKPSYRCEQVFVTTALTCSKVATVQQSCQGPGSAS